jgi:membrane peptidoglycan carboxypeptidase
MFKLVGAATGSACERSRPVQLRVVLRIPPRRFIVTGTWILLAACLVLLVALEMRTSWLASRLLSSFASRLSYEVQPGPNPSIVFPSTGPYDRRLGYDALPAFQSRLLAHGYGISAQARQSEAFRRLQALSLFPVYPEKTQAGLAVIGAQGRPLYARSDPERVYRSFDEIPPLVIHSLLFIENRELLDAGSPRRNPAVEWDRLAKAVLDLGLRQVRPGHPVSGGSTLATQLEKIRHSPDGRTSSVREKARQIASASLRSYLDGEETLAARKRIVLDYINSLPLASQPARGEITGLGDGLEAWFGADFDMVNRLLRLPPEGSPDPGELAAQGEAYRQALSLLLAIKKPSKFLLEDRAGLAVRVDNFLRMLAAAGVIGPRLRDAALAAPDAGRFRPVEMQRRSAGPPKSASSVRAELLGILGLRSVYDLDRLDLTVRTTLDEDADAAASALLRKLRDPEFASAAGITGARLLGPSGLDSVIYGFTLYERAPGANLLRVQVDNFDQPLNINQGTRLELGSTAKLRTLVTYLEIVEELHRAYASDPRSAAAQAPPDRLTRWAIDYLSSAPDRSLPAMLEAAMNRVYSASPAEAFFTGGGLHTFENFDRKDNARAMTVREAFQRSVNLVFIRLMRDVVEYHLHRGPVPAREILDNPNDPRRKSYLERFADMEGAKFLSGFYSKYQGLSPDDALQTLIAGIVPTPRRLAVIYRSVRPGASLEQFRAFLSAQPVAANLPAGMIDRLYSEFAPDRFDLNDRGYLARVHPLELWLLEYLSRRPGAPLGEVLSASAGVRQEVYRWLFKPARKAGQDTRIRTVLEMEAFERIHRRWARLGYPFPSLVPSLAAAIGSSGDSPAALAELAGILINDGVRLPAVRIRELRFAARTPFETVFERAPARGERVLSAEVASQARREMLGVVEHGTARRAFRSVVLAGGQILPVGGKTGTGDNRVRFYGPGGVEKGSRPLNRTAAFVFTIGDRFFGTVVAFVPGAEAGSYEFTSALPVQLFTQLVPAIRHVLDRPPADAPAPAAPPATLRASLARGALHGAAAPRRTHGPGPPGSARRPPAAQPSSIEFDSAATLPASSRACKGGNGE